MLALLDIFHEEPLKLHYGKKKKGGSKHSSSNATICISISFMLSCLIYFFIAARPLITGEKNTYASVTSGADVRYFGDFSKIGPMSFASFDVLPVLYLKDHNGRWLTFKDQAEVDRFQRIFTFGTSYWGENSDGKSIN